MLPFPSFLLCMFERLTKAQLSHQVLIAALSSGADSPPQLVDEGVLLPRKLLQAEALNAFVEDVRDRGKASDFGKVEDRDNDAEKVVAEQVHSSVGDDHGRGRRRRTTTNFASHLS